jgi:iron complex outermembrane receptor protein
LHITNEQGRVVIDSLVQGNYWLHVTYIGYHHHDEKVSIPQIGDWKIYLCLETHHLHETTISAKDAGINFVKRNSIFLDANEINKRQNQNIASMLSGISGVSMLNSSGNVAKPVIRGMHGIRLATLQGNTRIEGQQWGEDHGPEVDPFAVSQAEVIKGAATVEFGPEAIGGVIRLLPKEWQDSNGLAGTISLQAHSNNSQGAANLSLEGRRNLKNSWFAMRGNASFRKAGDSRAPDYIISNTGFEEHAGKIDAAYMRKRLFLEFNLSNYQTRQGIFVGSHLGNLNDLKLALNADKPLVIEPFTFQINRPNQWVNHTLFNGRLVYSFAKKSKYTLNYSQQANRRMEYDADFVYNPTLKDRPAMDLEIQTFQIEQVFESKLMHHLFLKVGHSAQFQNNTVAGLQFIIPGFKSHSQGLFAILKQELPHGSVSLGLRYDVRWLDVPTYRRFSATFSHNRNFDGATFVCSWQHQLPKEIILRVNLSSGFRPPAVNELYSYGLHYGIASFEVGNENLVPERAWLGDVSLRKQSGNWQTELNLFAQYYKGFIYKSPLANPILTIRGAFPAFEFKQSDGLFSGAEWSAGFQPEQGLQSIVQASYLYAQNTTQQQPFIFMPANRATFALGYKAKNWKAFSQPYLLLETQVVTRQKRVPPNIDFAVSPAAYQLVNLTGGTSFNLRESALQLYISFAINNLFNQRYRDYLSRYRYFTDDPGLNFIIRITFKF